MNRKQRIAIIVMYSLAFASGGSAPAANDFRSGASVTRVTVTPESSSRELNQSVRVVARDDAENAPYGDPERVLEEARIIASNAAKLNAEKSAISNTGGVVQVAKKKPKPPVTTYIKGYVFCGKAVKAAQKCIDKGKLTLYYPSGVPTLAGHNYMGWYWMDDLPNGRKVVIKSGKLKGTYKVYGHAKVYDKKFPKSGRGAAVALQTCEGKGIGFSFLRRI